MAARPVLGRTLRPVAGAAILLALALQFGSGPFLDGLRSVDARALLVALAVTAATTWCCARRWSLLAGRLDVPVTTTAAYAACHRAQFLNAVLPGGVAGDVHRGYRHGRDTGALGRGLRSVVWDRTSGQVVQVAAALVAVAWLTAPVPRAALGAPLLALVVAGVWLAGGVWPQVVGLSALAAAGHVVVYVVAARTAGVDAPLTVLVPLALVVLVAAAIPLSLAGWGPREGAAAWVFAATGLGGSTGIEVSVVYGVMALVATLPGALVLAVARRSASRRARVDGAGGLDTPSLVPHDGYSTNDRSRGDGSPSGLDTPSLVPHDGYSTNDRSRGDGSPSDRSRDGYSTNDGAPTSGGAGVTDG